MRVGAAITCAIILFVQTFSDEALAQAGKAALATRAHARTASQSIAGRWSSNMGFDYQINQSGSSFTWTAGNETAHGTIKGDEVEASWKGGYAPGSDKGHLAKDGLTITWNSGVVFIRK